jgi:hypothetical protein
MAREPRAPPALEPTAVSRRASAQPWSCSVSGSFRSATAIRGEPHAPSRVPRPRRSCGVTLTVETIRAGVGWPLTNVRRARAHAHDAGRLALQKEVEAALDDDSLWGRVAHVHVKDFDETHRDGNEPGTTSSRAKARSTSRPCSKPWGAAGIRRSRSRFPRSRPKLGGESRLQQLKPGSQAARGRSRLKSRHEVDRMRDHRPGVP